MQLTGKEIQEQQNENQGFGSIKYVDGYPLVVYTSPKGDQFQFKGTPSNA